MPHPQASGASQRSWSPPSASWDPRITAPAFQSTFYHPLSAPCQLSPGIRTTQGCSFITPILQMCRLRPRGIKQKFSGTTLPEVLRGQDDILTLYEETKARRHRAPWPIHGRAGMRTQGHMCPAMCVACTSADNLLSECQLSPCQSAQVRAGPWQVIVTTAGSLCSAPTEDQPQPRLTQTSHNPADGGPGVGGLNLQAQSWDTNAGCLTPKRPALNHLRVNCWLAGTCHIPIPWGTRQCSRQTGTK